MISLETAIRAIEFIILVAATAFFLYKIANIFQPDGTGFFGLNRRDK